MATAFLGPCTYVPKAKVAESGSGQHVRLAGAAALVIRFTPAAGADLSGPTLKITYTGPRRLVVTVR